MLLCMVALLLWIVCTTMVSALPINATHNEHFWLKNSIMTRGKSNVK